MESGPSKARECRDNEEKLKKQKTNLKALHFHIQMP